MAYKMIGLPAPSWVCRQVNRHTHKYLHKTPDPIVSFMQITFSSPLQFFPSIFPVIRPFFTCNLVATNSRDLPLCKIPDPIFRRSRNNHHLETLFPKMIHFLNRSRSYQTGQYTVSKQITLLLKNIFRHTGKKIRKYFFF